MKCRIQWLLVCLQSCATITTINSRTISVQNKHYPLVFTPYFSPIFSALGNHRSTFCPYRFAYSDTSWKWNHIICGLLWLASQYNVFKVHPCCSTYEYFIPFYGQIIFHWMNTYFICSFISWWTIGWVPFLKKSKSS